MNGKLSSLTDVLKKTLNFFEALPVSELVPYVHRKMLKDYNPEQVEEKINLCLSQHPCFYQQGNGQWCLNLEGSRENDQFYALLLKRKQPVNLREYLKNASLKKKKIKKIFSEETNLISDGRFVQLDNSYWGLTEWDLEVDQYSLKHLVIKAMRQHPGGLSLQQLYEIVSNWRLTENKTLNNILQKFPYFESTGDGIWTYNPVARSIYEILLKKFLGMVESQKLRWRREQARWNKKVSTLQKQLQEAAAAENEAAAALAEKIELVGRNDYLLTQMAEKDLLLSLRKKEILRYREHISRLEAKARSILHQCRLWVKRARDGEEAVSQIRDMLSKNQGSLEGLFTKLQQYKEKDRENKTKIAEMKEHHAVKVAELQTEIVELKQRLERERAAWSMEERRMKDEISDLSEELKNALRVEEDLQRALLAARQELAHSREEHKKLQRRVDNPLIKFILFITGRLKKQI
ncbi:MAG: phage-shock protein [Eubacteriales bacterium]